MEQSGSASSPAARLAGQRRRATSSWQRSASSRLRPEAQTGIRGTTSRTPGEARSVAHRISSSPTLASSPAANSRARAC